MGVIVGIDAGASSTKVAICCGKKVLGQATTINGRESSAAAGERALIEAMSVAGISRADVKAYAATGMGKTFIPFVDILLSEAASLAKGIHFVMPTARTVLDVGALKALTLRCEGGIPKAVAGNDRCASGTGSYVEMVARILRVPLEATGDLSLRSKENIEVQNTCAIFAESEVISLVHLKKQPEDILRGTFRGLAMRLLPSLARVKCEPDVAFVGGMARNPGIVRAIEEQINCPIVVPAHPLLVSAIGAAIIGLEQLGV